MSATRSSPASTCMRSTPRGAEAVCDRIAATGALEEVRADARARVEEAKRVVEAAPGLDDGQRRLLAMVADGVVERYA